MSALNDSGRSCPLPWVVVNDPATDLPTREQHEANPRLYLGVTRTGRVGAGEPEWYPDGRFASIWTPVGGNHLSAEELLMWLPIDVPADVMAALDASPKAKRSMLYRVMKKLK